MKNYKIHYFILIFCSLLFNISNINAQSNNCSTATPIILTNHTGCANGTTVGAVTDNIFYASCNPSPTTVNMVWYTYTTDGPNNNFTVTPGTLTNAELVVYTGGCPANGGLLQTCGNASGSTVLSSTWGMPAGTQVWLGVASYAGTEGTFQLCVTSTPSNNALSGSSCSSAENICTLSGFTINPMVANSSGQTSSCFSSAVQRDVWIKFTVTKTGLLAWTAMPTNTSTEFDWTVWDITGGCPGSEFCCNYNFAQQTGSGSSSGFGMHTGAGKKACGYSGGASDGPSGEFCAPQSVTCGHVYAIQVSNYTNNSSGFSIDFSGSTCEITTALPFTPSPAQQCGSSMTVNVTNTFTGTNCSTVTWDFGDGSATTTTTGTTNPPAHTYNTPGTYSITASVSGDCPQTSTQYVKLLGPLAITATAVDETCPGSCDGTADLTSATGGDGVYTYSWSNGATTSSLSGLCNGSYTLTVSNATCGTSANQTVAVNSASTTPAPTVTSPISYCKGATASQLSATGSSLQWYTASSGGAGSPTAPTPVTTTSGSTTYYVSQIIGGCEGPRVPITVNINAPPTASAGTDMILTCTTASLNLDGSGSTTGDNYSWTGGTITSGATTTSPTINAAGTYTLTVTDPTTNCTASDNVSVTLNNTPPNVDAGSDMVLTCTTTQVNLNGSSSTGGATFNWTGGTIVSGGTTATPTVSAANTYTLTVTDPTNGCTATDNVNVTLNNTPPNVDAGSDMVLTCTTTQVNLNGSSSTAGATFNWTGGTIVSNGTTATPTVSADGTYTLTVTDPTNGCTATDNVNVTLNNTPPNVDAGSDMVLTCTTTQVNLNGSSSTAGATFNWTGGTIVSGGTTATPTVNSANAYTLTVTDPTNGCTSTDNVDVTLNNTPPNADAGTDQTLTCSSPSLTLNGSSSTAGATFNWTGGTIVSGGTTATPTVSTAGTYTLTVTNPTNGCTATDNVDVSVAMGVPNVDAGSDMVLTCTTTQVNLNGSSSTAGVTFNWTGGTIVSGGTTATPTVSAANTYTLTVTDPTNGCTATDNVNVTLNNTPPNVDAGSDMVLTCTTTQVNLNGSSSTAGATFNWTGGTIVSNGTTAAPTVSADGTYTLTVTDPTNGCTATDNVNVTLNNTPPNADAGSDMVLTCTTTQVNLNGSSSTAGATFNWTGGTIVSNGTTAAPTVSADGTYTLTVTDPTNGCTATDNVDVTLNNTPPNADAGTDQTLTCSSPSLTLNGSSSTAGATFNWTGGTIVSGGTTATPTVSTAGTYTLTVTNPTNGCTATDNVDVSVAMGVPNVDAGSDMVLTCTTTQVNLNGSSSTAGVTFNWTGGTIVSGGTTATPTVSAANTYTLTVTDPTNGCTATDNVDVTLNNTPPNVDAGSDMILTCTTTQVNLNGSSSTAGATFNWTGGTIVSNGTTAAPTVSADGTYTLTVTDPTNGCTATDNVDVTLNNTPPNVDAGTDKILTCTTTQVNLNGSSSTAGATFSWTGGTPVSGGTTTTPTINTAGTYTMTVTDPTNGCTATDNVDVTLNNTPPNVDAGTDQTLTCSSPSLTLNGSSSTAGATFNWTGGTIVSGGTTPTPTVNTPGTYTLTVTDPTNGCTSTDNTTVNEAEGTPNVNAGSDQTINCTTTQVTLNGSSSTSGVTFSWSGGTIVSGGTTATPTVNTAGTYTLTVTDPTNGCTATNTVTVSTDTIHPNVTANGATVCAGESVTLSAQGASTYSWNGGINNGVAFVPTGDTTYYTVTGTNANGCTGTYTVSVIANPYPTAILSGTPLTGNPTLDVSFTNASLGANSFTWDFGEGATISENSTLGESHSYTSTGNYFVILTADNKGCIDTAMLEVIVIPFGPVGYHIPNIITPNGDGQNDYFVFNLVNAKALNVQIFNRWGNPIITLDDVDTKGWDGKTKSGTDVDEGTYFFLYKITGINGDVVNGQGFVQVQRN